MKKKILPVFLLAIITSGCYYDIEEQLYGLNTPCDTSNVTYSTTVVPILQNSGCFICHSGATASGGIRIDDYSSLKMQVSNGKLYGSISHSPGYSPMPQNGNKMTSCDLNKIKTWIDAGSPNN